MLVLRPLVFRLFIFTHIPFRFALARFSFVRFHAPSPSYRSFCSRKFSVCSLSRLFAFVPHILHSLILRSLVFRTFVFTLVRFSFSRFSCLLNICFYASLALSSFLCLRQRLFVLFRIASWANRLFARFHGRSVLFCFVSFAVACFPYLSFHARSVLFCSFYARSYSVCSFSHTFLFVLRLPAIRSFAFMLVRLRFAHFFSRKFSVCSLSRLFAFVPHILHSLILRSLVFRTFVFTLVRFSFSRFSCLLNICFYASLAVSSFLCLWQRLFVLFRIASWVNRLLDRFHGRSVLFCFVRSAVARFSVLCFHARLFFFCSFCAISLFACSLIFLRFSRLSRGPNLLYVPPFTSV